MITVSNTTAITTLLKIGHSDLLTRLFGEVWVPSTVEQELLAFHASLPHSCVVQSVPDSDLLRHLLGQADRGEAEAICLAVQARADVLLIDDKKGRRLAEAYDVHCLGLPAVVLAAHRRGLVRSVAAFLDLMERQGNYGLSARARAQVLRLCRQ